MFQQGTENRKSSRARREWKVLSADKTETGIGKEGKEDSNDDRLPVEDTAMDLNSHGRREERKGVIVCPQ
jgi:hypothetical protein